MARAYWRPAAIALGSVCASWRACRMETMSKVSGAGSALVVVVACSCSVAPVTFTPLGDASEIDGPAIVDAPAIDGHPVGCPADFAPLPGGPAGHVYRRAPQSGEASQQFDFCRGISVRTYLAVPNDATELMNLRALASMSSFWIGIDDRVTEGVYVEVETGSPATFLPWAAGQPYDVSGAADCVLALSAVISDERCDGINRLAVCECNP